ncbi:MAG: sugar transferase [Faecalibacterium sp.]|nr:sugar transferase [Ruminococcus sp.]MCM1391469.1 sugar transferase [Ruminococcus sp.]MCM1485273.1 sugar transferase [Faecalibacterium sp.]
MNKKKYLKEKIILYFFKILICAFFTGGMCYCWMVYFNPFVPTPFYRYGNYLMAVVFLAVYVGFVKVYGGFLVGTSPVSDLVFSQIIAIAFLQVISYVVFSLLSYRLVSVVPFLIMFAIFSAFAVIWSFAVDFVYYKMHAPKKTIVVFNNVDSYLSLKGVRSMDRRFRVVRTVNSEKTSLEELFDYMKSVDGVFLCGVPSDYRNEVVKHCIAVGKVAYIKPKISDTIIRGGRTIQLMNIPVYRCKRSDTSLIYQFGKRAADIVFSILAIIILSPVMLLTSLAIKLDDGGPVFYKQTRLTLNGKKFKIVKFRSMRVDAEKDGIARLAKDHDDRITKVGRIIRKCRIDELPQIFNILTGSMSIVGPRPERPEIAKEYEESMPEFALRLQVKAGLTGYAQVYGKYNTPPYDKVQMDLMYVANQSFLEDIKLILMTLKIMFIPSSTDGISNNQITAMRKDNNDNIK